MGKIDIHTFSPNLIVDCFSQNILEVSAYDSYPIELKLDKFKGKEVFLDLQFFERYNLECTPQKKEFIVAKRSDKALILLDIESRKTFTLIKDVQD